MKTLNFITDARLPSSQIPLFPLELKAILAARNHPVMSARPMWFVGRCRSEKLPRPILQLRMRRQREFRRCAQLLPLQPVIQGVDLPCPRQQIELIGVSLLPVPFQIDCGERREHIVGLSRVAARARKRFAIVGKSLGQFGCQLVPDEVSRKRGIGIRFVLNPFQSLLARKHFKLGA